MKNLKYILISFILGGTAVGGVMSLNLGANELSVQEKTAIQAEVLKTHPDTVGWVKPTKDAEWAEDVKKEGLEYRSTKVLNEMLTNHSAKLQREQEALPKYLDCVDCIRWEMREQLKNSGLVGQELETEIEKQTWERINERMWSVSKLQQAVERMEKEIELRDKGFVVVVGEENLLGASVPPERIRNVIE